MTVNVLRSFAAGLFVATTVCGAVYFTGPNKASSSETETNVTLPSEEEMKEMLTSAGYVIHSEEEWKQQVQETEEAETIVKDEPAAEEKVIDRISVNVVEGMTSIDVGEALEGGNIIDDAMTFFKEVEARGLSNDLKPGSYQVDSSMTMNEIMNTIFKK